jgi:hypothetical protein
MAILRRRLHRLGFRADEGLPNRVEDFHVIPSTAKFPLSATRLGQKETAGRHAHATCPWAGRYGDQQKIIALGIRPRHGLTYLQDSRATILHGNNSRAYS